MSTNETHSKNDKDTIYSYRDYRTLLRDLYLKNKTQNKNFSYRYFARIAGFGSASFLKRVIDGESDLSEDSIDKIIKGFKLTKDESRFFRHLVLLNQAKTAEEKAYQAKEIIRIDAYRKIYPLSESQYNMYAKWYYIPIRELVDLPGFEESPEWISKNLVPEITPDEAATALAEMIKVGVLIRDENSNLKLSNRYLSTADEVSSSAIAKWHQEMMARASQSIDSIVREERDISSVTLRISKESLKKAKEMIHNFRKELIETLSQEHFEAVYELNLQLFPLSKTPNRGSQSE